MKGHKRNWARLIASILLLIVGILILANPGALPRTLLIWVGILLLVAGIGRIVYYFGGSMFTTGWDIVAGVLDILAGILVLIMNPLAGIAFIGYLLAFYVMANGITGLISSFHMRSINKYWWLGLIWGILAIVFSIVMLVNPLETSLLFAYIFAMYAVLGGIVGILNFAFNTQPRGWW